MARVDLLLAEVACQRLDHHLGRGGGDGHTALPKREPGAERERDVDPKLI